MDTTRNAAAMAAHLAAEDEALRRFEDFWDRAYDRQQAQRVPDVLDWQRVADASLDRDPRPTVITAEKRILTLLGAL